MNRRPAPSTRVKPAPPHMPLPLSSLSTLVACLLLYLKNAQDVHDIVGIASTMFPGRSSGEATSCKLCDRITNLLLRQTCCLS